MKLGKAVGKAGIVCEDWKLPIFEKVLKAAGFEMSNRYRFAEGVTAFHVNMPPEQFPALTKAVAEAMAEAKEVSRQVANVVTPKH